MKLLSIIAVGLLSCSVLCTFNPMTAKAEGKLSKEKIAEFWERVDRPYAVELISSDNPYSKSDSKGILLNRLEENIGVDESGKVTSFILMECVVPTYGDLFFAKDNDLLVKVHPDGHFTAFRTVRSGSISPMGQDHTWSAVGDEITFENLKQHSQWIRNRFKLFPKALKEAQATVEFREKLKEMLK